MRRSSIFISVFIIHTNLIFAQTQQPKILGFWYAEELSQSTLHIFQDSAGLIFGKITKSKDSDKIGRTPLYNFKYVRSEKKFIGKVKSATSPLELDGEITCINDKTLELVGSKFLLKKRFRLISVDDPIKLR